MKPFTRKAEVGLCRPRLYLVIKVSNQFQMVFAALKEHNTISLLGHEKAQRQRQLVVQQHVLQPLWRLLSISDLAEVSSLLGRVTVARCVQGQFVSHTVSRMGTMLRSTHLCLELLSPRHGLQLLWRHLICDFNAGHFLHHLLQDQQVETNRTERVFIFWGNRLFRRRSGGNSLKCFTFFLLSVDWSHTEGGQQVQWGTSWIRLRTD